MKVTFGNYKALKQLSQEGALALPPDMNMPLDDILPGGFNLEDIPATVLAQMFDHDLVASTAERFRDVGPALGHTAETLRNAQQGQLYEEEEDGGAFEDQDESDFFFSPDDSYGYKNFQSNFRQQTKHENPSGFKHMYQQARKFQGLVRIPESLKAKIKGSNKGVSTRRERRRRHLELDQTCQQTEDVCTQLRGCVNRLKPYDYTVLYAGKGFVDDANGNFTVDPDQLNLFDVDGQLSAKIAHIKTLATGTGDCSDLLAEFHTACQDGMTCSSPNSESFQLSVDEVCDAVDSPTLLRIEEIAEKYDALSVLG